MTAHDGRVTTLNTRTSIVTPWTKLTEAPEDVQWLVDGIIPAGLQTQIVAPSGVGKSLFTLGLALSVCEGSPFLGAHKASKGRVLWLDYENGKQRLVSRLAAYGYPLSDTFLHDRFYYCEFPALPSLETKAAADQVEYEIDTLNIDLVVIDSMAKAFHGDENESKQYRAFGNGLGAAARRREVAIVFLDNTGKDIGRGGRGSQAKMDEADIQWILKATGDDTFSLELEKDRLGESPDLIRFQKGGHPLTWVPLAHGLSPGALKVLRSWSSAGPDEGVTPGVTPRSVTHARELGMTGKQAYVSQAVRWLKANGINALKDIT